MSGKSMLVFLVASEVDKPFWDMAALLKKTKSCCIKVTSMTELLTHEELDNASVIIISTTIMDRKGVESYCLNKSLVVSPVLIAGSYEHKEDEYRLRDAGVLCFLLLPDEADMILEFIDKIHNTSQSNKQT